MSFEFYPMDDKRARAILAWRYPSPYNCYDLNAEDVEGTVAFFVDPENAYYAITDRLGKLVGYCCFGADAQVPGGDYGAAALDIGLGAHPDLTGQGQGFTFVSACLEFARQAYPARMWRVTIARFNRRARRVWEKAGFRYAVSFRRDPDQEPFDILVRGV